ncbi:enolase C-terminal domain-like protein [Gryllotalpicola reticulitermitis]|uniref:Enolase C-terminal domain-like protein n=1 Tax=Gryllotalpicola reticulitermitis TaxID=1184153 RepID=A0ABV8Q6B8_9MICO
MIPASDPIDRVTAEVYRVPTDQPEADGTAEWDATTVVVVRVAAGEIEGLGYSYADASAALVVTKVLAPLVRGACASDLPYLRDAMDRAVRNLGRAGVVACAISAVDVALWDLRARLVRMPLLELLGRARAAAPVYGSGGFTTYDDDTTAAQLREWLELGVGAAKIKIGESAGAAEARDLQRVALAREVLGDVELFVDANGGYTPSQARRVERDLRDFDVRWFEEPVSSDYPAELAAVRAGAAMDIAAGEYCWGIQDAARLLAAGAVDCLQLDVTRCGGFTGWLEGAALAEASGISISAHCAPQLSAHAVCAVRRARHLEYFHDHARIEPLLFDGALEVREGSIEPAGTPGLGLTLGPRAEQFRV